MITVIMSLFTFSCKKTPGPAGPAGKDGTNGTNGSANIQTYTVALSGANWAYDNTEKSYTAVISINAITSAVVNKGTIQVFSGDQSGYIALPYSYQGQEFNYSYETGYVYLVFTLTDGTTPPNPGAMNFKIVVIPGS